MENMRIKNLRMWMFNRDITFQAIANRTGMSLATANRLLNAETIPTIRHRQFLSLGIPAEMLPPAFDKKNGRKPKIPQFPVDENEDQ